MTRNWLPTILAFAPAILLPIAQDVLRPRFPHTGLAGLVLGSASDLIIGFCFPFSIILRPRLMTARGAAMMFHVWCGLTLSVLVAMELYDPFGLNVFDPRDILAGVLGVGAALAVFHGWLRGRLAYADGGTIR